jgi:hypothetical protein
MIKLEATEVEVQALAGLLDAGLRATGLRGAKDAAVWIAKLEVAVELAKQGRPVSEQ